MLSDQKRSLTHRDIRKCQDFNPGARIWGALASSRTLKFACKDRARVDYSFRAQTFFAEPSIENITKKIVKISLRTL